MIIATTELHWSAVHSKATTFSQQCLFRFRFTLQGIGNTGRNNSGINNSGNGNQVRTRTRTMITIATTELDWTGVL
jgi:hypothetical protein